MSSAETLTLAAFLHDRINEDAAVARKASLLRVTVALDATKPGYGVQAADMVFVRRFAPMRVRAECEAKRRIVASAIDPTVMCEVSDDVLRALALPYADHPTTARNGGRTVALIPVGRRAHDRLPVYCPFIRAVRGGRCERTPYV